MLLPQNEHSFYCKVQGEKTKEWFEGTFTTKCILNQQEQIEIALRVDRYNMGSKTLAPQYALINRTIAELEVRMIKAPTWWTENDSGRLLYDTNVVFQVFTDAMKGEDVFAERLNQKADQAEKKLEEIKETNGK